MIEQIYWNTAQEGGGIYSPVDVICDGGTNIYENSAIIGGGIATNTYMHAIGCKVTNNTATSRGGGMDLDGSGLIYIFNFNFSGNSAPVGGTLNSEFSFLTLEKGQFIDEAIFSMLSIRFSLRIMVAAFMLPIALCYS